MTELETRVGYMALHMLKEEITQYVIAHTIKGEYTGDVVYLSFLQNINEYLQKDDKHESKHY